MQPAGAGCFASGRLLLDGLSPGAPSTSVGNGCVHQTAVVQKRCFQQASDIICVSESSGFGEGQVL